MDSTPFMDTGAHHDARIPHLFFSEGPTNPCPMQCNSPLPFCWRKGRMAWLRARRANLICSQAHCMLLLAQENEHRRRSWTKRQNGAVCCTKGHTGCAWQQNNQSGMVVSASNSFGVVCNCVYLELHCHCACISVAAYPNLTNSHHPGQALDRFCTQKGL